MLESVIVKNFVNAPVSSWRKVITALGKCNRAGEDPSKGFWIIKSLKTALPPPPPPPGNAIPTARMWIEHESMANEVARKVVRFIDAFVDELDLAAAGFVGVEATEEAKRNGLAVVIWSYPRGSDLTKVGKSARAMG